MTKTKKASFLKKIKPYMGNKRAFIPTALITSAIASLLNIIPFIYIMNLWKSMEFIRKCGMNINHQLPGILRRERK